MMASVTPFASEPVEGSPEGDSEHSPTFSDLMQRAAEEHNRIVASIGDDLEQSRGEARELRQKLAEICNMQMSHDQPSQMLKEANHPNGNGEAAADDPQSLGTNPELLFQPPSTPLLSVLLVPEGEPPHGKSGPSISNVSNPSGAPEALTFRCKGSASSSSMSSRSNHSGFSEAPNIGSNASTSSSVPTLLRGNETFEHLPSHIADCGQSPSTPASHRAPHDLSQAPLALASHATSCNGGSDPSTPSAHVVWSSSTRIAISETYRQWQTRRIQCNSNNSTITTDEVDGLEIKPVKAKKCSCGVAFNELDSFCRGCGAQRRVVMDTCVHCRTSLVDDAEFCPTCGEIRQAAHMIKAAHPLYNSITESAIKLPNWLRLGSPSKSKLNTSKTLQLVEERQANLASEHCLLDRLVHHPSKPWRLCFDVFGVLLVAYDLYMLPLQNCFDFDESTFTGFVQTVCFHYWNIHFCVSFFLSYTENGVAVTRARRTAIHYLKTWFSLDAFVLLPDWTSVLAGDLEHSQSAGFLTKTFRVARLLRMIRLVRLFKLLIIVGRIGELVQINSELLSILANVVKSVAILLTITHLIACAWYFCANIQKASRETWVTSNGYENVAWFHIYVISLHWSLTQFTPASMSVQPENVIERIFTVVIVVFAMVMFSYILGSVSASMAELRKLNEDYSKNFWHARRFMRQHCVPVTLALRIKQYLEKKYTANQTKMQVTDVPLFAILSQQLKNDLAFARIKRYLYHPLFEHLQDETVFMGQIVERSIKEQHFAKEDEVFYQGEPSSSMHFVAEGRLEYARLCARQEEVVSESIHAGETAWLAESSLWVEAWHYRGCAIVTEDSLIISINGRSFGDLCTKHSERLRLLFKYGRFYASNLLEYDTDLRRSISGSCPVTSFIAAHERTSNKRSLTSFSSIFGKIRGTAFRIDPIISN